MKTIRRSALLSHPPDAVFEVVNDVESYPQFVPGCESAQVLETNDNEMVASVLVRARGLRERFTTRNTVSPPYTIALELIEGPFKSLDGTWQLTPLGDAGCKVEISLSYELAGVAKALGPLIGRAADKVVDAFCRRVERQQAAGR